jgi:hypothetical protein
MQVAEAQKHGAWIVSESFLLSCAASNTKLDESGFLLVPRSSPAVYFAPSFHVASPGAAFAVRRR